MKAYRLTERESILRALRKAADRPAETSSGPVRITAIDEASNVSDRILIQTDRPVKDSLLFKFNASSMQVRVEELAEGQYSIKDVVLESPERGAQRVSELENRIVRNVLVHPPVDIASGVALYGKTAVIARACQMMRMLLQNHLNAHGFMIADCEIGFFYNADDAIHLAVEAQAKSFLLIDALSRKVCSLEAFCDPLSELEAGKLENRFQRFTRGGLRSQLIYPFGDSVGNLMGFMRFESTMPGLGNPGLADANHNPAAARLFLNFLRDRAEELVFDMEIGMIKSWAKAADKEVLLDISQNARGCRITLHQTVNERILRRGSKLQFQMDLGQAGVHTFFCTVRNLTPEENRTSVGLRINRGGQQNSIESLARLASAERPDVE
ncbi:MAG: hypothetical protein H7A21_02280 [Spirochaetales bacterium]|nr:hypothetical protein [Leptospiraceae bacterium]MCP5480235.1 hypothetical protein [Spirochaetales bacterium]MCP5486366.1 hypothetical protein [Spirochaetales bacterium]